MKFIEKTQDLLKKFIDNGVKILIIKLILNKIKWQRWEE
mgnify:CR=1 FL=1